MNSSAINPLNSVPLVQSTQILASTAQPVVSQIPVAASTPIVSQVPVAAQPIQSVVPTITQPVQSVVPNMAQDQHYATQTTLSTLVDEDYRLGRGILDDFRPNAYKTQIGVVGNTTTNVVTSSAIPTVSTPIVSTPMVNVGAPNLSGAAALKDFL